MKQNKRQTTIWVSPKDDKISDELDGYVPPMIANNRSAKVAFAMWALLASYKEDELEKEKKRDE